MNEWCLTMWPFVGLHICCDSHVRVLPMQKTPFLKYTGSTKCVQASDFDNADIEIEQTLHCRPFALH